MSIKAMSLVWEYSEQKGSALLMLLAIADYAKDDGTGAWPSIATLARKVRVTRRHAIRIIKKLEEAGELRVQRDESEHKSNVYDIVFPEEVLVTPTSLVTSGLVTPASLGGDTHVTRGVTPTSLAVVTPTSPDPLVDPLKTHYVSVTRDEDSRDQNSLFNPQQRPSIYPLR